MYTLIDSCVGQAEGHERGQLLLVKPSESLFAALQGMVDCVTSNPLLWAAPPCQRICQKAAMHNFAKYLNLFAQQISPPSGSRNSKIFSSLPLSPTYCVLIWTMNLNHINHHIRYSNMITVNIVILDITKLYIYFATTRYCLFAHSVCANFGLNAHYLWSICTYNMYNSALSCTYNIYILCTINSFCSHALWANKAYLFLYKPSNPYSIHVIIMSPAICDM